MHCCLCGRSITQSWPLTALMSGRSLNAPTTCAECQSRFDVIEPQHTCPDCGRPNASTRCDDCQYWHQRDGVNLTNRAVYHYNTALKDVMHQYKAVGDYRLHGAFRVELSHLCRHVGVLVPLTTEPAHMDRRGFDPVVGLFGHLPLRLWLTKTDTDQPQARKKRVARLRTPQSFHCVASLGALRRTRQICLLDDLYTTGTTLHHAAAALRAAGFDGRVISRTLIR